MRSARHWLVQPCPHFSTASTARLLEYNIAVPHHDEIRNGLNLKLRCQIGVFLSIYLQDNRRASHFIS